MSTKQLTKEELQRRCKIDDIRLNQLISDGIVEKKETFTEEEAEQIRAYRKDNPILREDIQKRFKLEDSLLQTFITKGMIQDKYFYSEKETEIFKSFVKLRKLGYNETACLQVLKEVGIPREDNLFEDSRYIQLKDLAEITTVPERTIKFYEKSNVIKKPRIYKNKRFYSRTVKEELEFIRDLQKIGYKLNDISAFLVSLRQDTAERHREIPQLLKELAEKKEIIDTIIAKLKERT